MTETDVTYEWMSWPGLNQSAATPATATASSINKSLLKCLPVPSWLWLLLQCCSQLTLTAHIPVRGISGQQCTSWGSEVASKTDDHWDLCLLCNFIPVVEIAGRNVVSPVFPVYQYSSHISTMGSHHCPACPQFAVQRLHFITQLRWSYWLRLAALIDNIAITVSFIPTPGGQHCNRPEIFLMFCFMKRKKSVLTPEEWDVFRMKLKSHDHGFCSQHI